MTVQLATALAGLIVPFVQVTVVATVEQELPAGTVAAVNAGAVEPLAIVVPKKLQAAPGATVQEATALAGLMVPFVQVAVVATEEQSEPKGTVEAVKAGAVAPVARVVPKKLQGAPGKTEQVANAFAGLNTPLVHVTVVATDEHSEPNGTVAELNAATLAPLAKV